MNVGPSAASRPLVSVIIPTYNRADYIAEAIDSVLGQTYPAIEIIVIDDGSTDDSRAIVERFGPKVHYVLQDNAERGAARNHGLRLAKGKYIAFLDSDDLWLPTKAEEDVAFLERNPGVGLLCTDAIQIDGDGKELKVLRAKAASGRVSDNLLRHNFVLMAAHLARTSLLREIGGFREERQLAGSEDWEMWVRLSLRTEFAYAPRLSGKVRTHPDNTMSNAAAMHRSMARAIELFRQNEALARGSKKSLGRMEATVALVNAINHCSQRQRGKSLRFLKDAVRADPTILLDPRFAYTVLRLTGWRTR